MGNKRLIAIISIFLAVVMGFSQFGGFGLVKAAGPGDAIQASAYKAGDEIISERTETAKKHYLGGNTYSLDVSLAAIHYKDNYADKSESWKDIDLSFDGQNRITKAPYELTVDAQNYAITVKDKKTGKVTILRLDKVGDKAAKDIKQTAKISKGKVQWNEIAADLDLAITADNTQVNFDWIVKSENAPHQVEFEIQDGGVPITFKGFDADREAVDVTAVKTGTKIVERIEKGGKYPKTINPTLDLQIGSSANDGFIDDYAGNFYSTSFNQLGKNYWSYYQIYYHFDSWYRWTGFSIPSGSTVSSNSYISLKARSNLLWAGPINTKVYFDDQSSPSAPGSASDYLSRTPTTNYVSWDISESTWTSDTWYNSASLQNVLQELINSYGTITTMQSLHKDTTTAATQQNRSANCYGYDNSSSDAPKIHVEYTTVHSTHYYDNWWVNWNGHESHVEWWYSQEGSYNHYSEIDAAASAWNATPTVINMVHVSSRDDSVLRAYSADYGDTGWYGRHTPYPFWGNIELDDWYCQYNLTPTEWATVAAHEMGHAHGLGHYYCDDELMDDPCVNRGGPDPYEGDIAGVNAKY